MERDFWGLASGLLVLALGILAVVALVRPQAEPSPATTPVALPATSAIPETTTVVEPAPASPELPGVPVEVTRALEQNGDATLASADELAQLPPSVVAVLVEYGVPLRVPISGDGE